MLTVLTASALRWMEHHRRRAALRNLLTNDDATLRDIGVSRPEIERALEAPFDAGDAGWLGDGIAARLRRRGRR